MLAGLKATLTGTLYAYKYVSARGSAGTSGRSTTVAPTFALEGLSYNLNIWNDGMNKAEVLARPSLLAVESQTSQFYSGAVLHVQLNSNNSDGSLVDVPVGINLSITPTFLDNETIKIKVHADRSFIESRSEKLGFSAFSQTSKTSVDATAVMKFGETLILSGLSENETTKAKSGVPFLQSIPIIQSLFSNKTEQEMKKSVMILIAYDARRSQGDEEGYAQGPGGGGSPEGPEGQGGPGLQGQYGYGLRGAVQGPVLQGIPERRPEAGRMAQFRQYGRLHQARARFPLVLR